MLNECPMSCGCKPHYMHWLDKYKDCKAWAARGDCAPHMRVSATHELVQDVCKITCGLSLQFPDRYADCPARASRGECDGGVVTEDGHKFPVMSACVCGTSC